MVSLTASVVTYIPEPGVFARALASLAAAIQEARRRGLLGEARLYVIDNGPEGARAAVASVLAGWPPAAADLELITGQGNVGYGRANNLALERARSELHLVLNPDVELEPGALAEAIVALQSHPEVGMVAPAVYDEAGAMQYLCRRYPSVWVLFLRGFAPEGMRRRNADVLAHYEMRDLIADRYVDSVPLASGCFMLARTPLLKRVGGFDPGYFMYFEDYDLSLRIASEAQVAYEPRVRIVHHGGEAARKGPRHVFWFVRSAWRFFARHGWRLA